MSFAIRALTQSTARPNRAGNCCRNRLSRAALRFSVSSSPGSFGHSGNSGSSFPKLLTSATCFYKKSPQPVVKGVTAGCGGEARAIDGTRTRGLDLGKVARYQLRHYRICPYLGHSEYSIVSHARQAFFTTVPCRDRFPPNFGSRRPESYRPRGHSGHAPHCSRFHRSA